VPLVTPNGNPGNAGRVVATPTFVPSGAQQWICAATSFDVKPEKLTVQLKRLRGGIKYDRRKARCGRRICRDLVCAAKSERKMNRSSVCGTCREKAERCA
jgi:hypothetical protein